MQYIFCVSNIFFFYLLICFMNFIYSFFYTPVYIICVSNIFFFYLLIFLRERARIHWNAYLNKLHQPELSISAGFIGQIKVQMSAIGGNTFTIKIRRYYFFVIVPNCNIHIGFCLQIEEIRNIFFGSCHIPYQLFGRFTFCCCFLL